MCHPTATTAAIEEGTLAETEALIPLQSHRTKSSERSRRLHLIFFLIVFLTIAFIVASNKLAAEWTIKTIQAGTPEISANNSSGSTVAIPRVLYQTYKTKDVENITDDRKEWINSWNTDPSIKHEIYTDQMMEEFVILNFPVEIVRAFFRLPLLVQRTDFWRYLVIYKLGGIFADTDVKLLRPFSHWYLGHKEEEIGFIGGVEFYREDDEQNRQNDPNRHHIQITQWVFASAPSHPILGKVIQNMTTAIMGATRERLREVGQVIYLTGPIPWSMCIREYLLDLAGQDIDVMDNDTKRSMRIGDVLLHSKDGFGWFGSDTAMVGHQFSGQRVDGWKNRKD